MYREDEIDRPFHGVWSGDEGALPYTLQANRNTGVHLTQSDVAAARRAFYALCTHIDHQLRVVIGVLREEALLDNTIICFTADHGDMLGNHGLWAKRLFYENSANIPLLLVGTSGASGDGRVGHHRVDDRLVGQQDIMPTLLDLCGIPIPETVEGMSMVGERRRDWLYAEIGEDATATRMVHDGRHKLIYYPVGNRRQLFDERDDPQELNDVAASPAYSAAVERLTQTLIGQLYGGDETRVRNGDLVGLPARRFVPGPNKGLSSQRGTHWPPPPKTNMRQIRWTHEADRPA
jgi:arylsulfatase A-like enzyme